MSYFLTKEDWVEIAYALEDKLKSPVVQGDGSWVRHIRTIQDIIGPDGVNMTEETPEPMVYEKAHALAKAYSAWAGKNETERELICALRMIKNYLEV
jgi:hypothetical protein